MNYMRYLLASLFLCGLLVTIAFGQESKLDAAAEQYFTNTELIDQDGKTHRFYGDLLKGKTVIISSFHTSCTTTGPPTDARLMEIQNAFKDQMGSELLIISITLEPEIDRPDRLKAFAAKFSAVPGWLFLTGEKANVELILKKLGLFVSYVEDHVTILLIGNVETGLWKKAYALANVRELIPIVKSVLEDKGN